MTRSEYKNYSGKFVMKKLEKFFYCRFISQRGSHVKLKNSENKTVIVPLHKTLAYGTFKSILSQAGVSEKNFYNIS